MKNTIISFHVEKTGGTSLKQWWTQQFGDRFRQLDIWSDESVEECETLLADPETAPQVIHGHFPVDVHRQFGLDDGAVEYVTLLRAPVLRFVSHYTHWWERPDEPKFQEMRHKSLGKIGKFLQDPISHHICNLYVRRLTGKTTGPVDEGDLEEAWIRIQEFAVVGSLEDVNPFLRAVEDRYDLPEKGFGWANAGGSTAKDSLTEELTTLIADHNSLDCELYSRVLQNL